MIIPPCISINKALHPEDTAIIDKYESDEKVLFHAESDFNDINVVETDSGRFLKFDSSYQSGILNYGKNPDNMPNINYYFISCILNPNIKNILILGMGSGYFIKGFLKLLPALKKIDIVEFDPLIIDIAESYFDYIPNKRVKIHIQDARVFVRNSKIKYDLIVMDLFSQDGMSYRFMTREFLQEVKLALSSEGIFSSNLFGLLSFDHNDYIFNSMLKTYKSVFKDVLTIPTYYANHEIYRNIFGLKHDLPALINIILFASNAGITVNRADLIKKSGEFKKIHNVKEIEKIDKYVEDLVEFNINLDNYSVLKDDWELNSQFNIDNLKDFLYTDHVNSDRKDKINPLDDEGLAENP
jgi:spermidine synthase